MFRHRTLRIHASKVALGAESQSDFQTPGLITYTFYDFDCKAGLYVYLKDLVLGSSSTQTLFVSLDSVLFWILGYWPLGLLRTGGF